MDAINANARSVADETNSAKHRNLCKKQKKLVIAMLKTASCSYDRACQLVADDNLGKPSYSKKTIIRNVPRNTLEKYLK